MARMKGDVSSKATEVVQSRRHDNAAHRKRLIVVAAAVLVDPLGDGQSFGVVCEIMSISGAGSCPEDRRIIISGTVFQVQLSSC
jgi:hypothetical protein